METKTQMGKKEGKRCIRHPHLTDKGPTCCVTARGKITCDLSFLLPLLFFSSVVSVRLEAKADGEVGEIGRWQDGKQLGDEAAGTPRNR